MDNWHIPHDSPAYQHGTIWWFSPNMAVTQHCTLDISAADSMSHHVDGLIPPKWISRCPKSPIAGCMLPQSLASKGTGYRIQAQGELHQIGGCSTRNRASDHNTVHICKDDITDTSSQYSLSVFLQLHARVFVWYVLLGSTTTYRESREATANTAEGLMLHSGQTHSFAIKRGEAMEGGNDILLNKHRISLSRKAPYELYSATKWPQKT